MIKIWHLKKIVDEIQELCEKDITTIDNRDNLAKRFWYIFEIANQIFEQGDFKGDVEDIDKIIGTILTIKINVRNHKEDSCLDSWSYIESWRIAKNQILMNLVLIEILINTVKGKPVIFPQEHQGTTCPTGHDGEDGNKKKEKE